MSKSQLIAIVDTREQQPLDLTKYGLEVVTETLTHGDYSLKYPNLKRHVAIERKSLPDLVACCGRERDRFNRELLALRGYRHRYVVCECSMTDIVDHKYRSRILPQSVIGSIARWSTMGVPFVFADNAEIASRITAKLLTMIATEVIEFSKAATA